MSPTHAVDPHLTCRRSLIRTVFRCSFGLPRLPTKGRAVAARGRACRTNGRRRPAAPTRHGRRSVPVASLVGERHGATRRRLRAWRVAPPAALRCRRQLNRKPNRWPYVGAVCLVTDAEQTPFCSAPLLVCLMGHCQDLVRVTALIMMRSELLNT